MFWKRRDFSYSLIVLLSIIVLIATQEQCIESQELNQREPIYRLVAIGDLHGDFPNAMKVLRMSNIIDTHGHWIAGTTHLVQTGDIVDRGPNSTALIDFFTTLQEEAEEAGGRVTCLLGNHELMVLQGDLRYVARQELLHLADEAGRVGDMGAGRRAWAALYSPQAVRGATLRSNRKVAVVAGEGRCRTLFSHAGVLPQHLGSDPSVGLERLNEQISAMISGTKPERHRLFGDEGPFWYRGYAMQSERGECPLLARVLDSVGAQQMVIGHTVQDEGINQRCGGAMNLIDVGISRVYGGNLAAWECSEHEGPSAIYPNGIKVPLRPPSASPHPAGAISQQEARGRASKISSERQPIGTWGMISFGILAFIVVRQLQSCLKWVVGEKEPSENSKQRE